MKLRPPDLDPIKVEWLAHSWSLGQRRFIPSVRAICHVGCSRRASNRDLSSRPSSYPHAALVPWYCLRRGLLGSPGS